MMEFYITGQTIRCSTPAIAAQSLKYLEASFKFAGEEWNGYSKWAHFRQGERVMDFALDENDMITADKELNLTIGEWEVYVTGANEEDSRITTLVFVISVYASGLIDEPLHAMPASVVEQVDAKASTALLMAAAVKDMADAGEFDGDSFKMQGFYATLGELMSAVTEPAPGDAYGVGAEPPFEVYIYNSVNGEWVNNGPLTGAPGADGAPGATFTPIVDGNGNLSWTNNGGLPNPATVNIKGPTGAKGEAGADGKGPYEVAKANGYTGTEATFNAALTQFPYHNARHAAGGVDPITVETGNLKGNAVTRAKLANDALYSPMKATLTATAYSFVADDLGKTVAPSSGAADLDIEYTITSEVSQALPQGAEIAVLFRYGKSLKIKFGTDVQSAVVGDTIFKANRTYSIPERFGMVALKKVDFATSSGVNYWIVIGNVEVVS